MKFHKYGISFNEIPYLKFHKFIAYTHPMEENPFVVQILVNMEFIKFE